MAAAAAVATTIKVKVAIVTGASRGIGQAIAKRLGSDGLAVVVNYTNGKQQADEVVKSIVSGGGKAIAVQGDVSKADDVKRLFDEAEKTWGGVDVLVSNAGKSVNKLLADYSEADFDSLVSINIKGAFLCIREAAKRLRNGGRIINISASFHGAPKPTYGPYSCTKMAVEQLVMVAAKELGPRNITVNTVRPGPTHTDLFMNGKSAEMVKQIGSMSALGRLGEPEDIAPMVSFLASDESGWVTGQAIGANGGYW